MSAEETRDALDLDSLEAAAKSATPGPWMLDGMGEDEPEINYWAHRFIGTANPNDSGSHEIIATSEDGHGPNAAFIAAADPRTVLALIAIAREWQASREVTEAEEIAAAEALVVARYGQHGVSIEAARRDERMYQADIEYLRPQARAALVAAREVRS